MCTAHDNLSFHDLYNKPENYTAFSSKKRLTDYLKQANRKSDLGRVDEWLRGEASYTLHKPRRVNFRRNKYSLGNIGDFWQADLMDVQNLSRKNKGYKYILAVIDCFSKYGWCVPIKKKRPADVIEAFEKILQNCRYKPRNLHTDKGREFVNGPFQSFLTRNDIVFHKAVDPATKASICERYIRTMKSIMYRYFTYANVEKYLDVLESLVTLYNNRRHRSIGMAPANVNECNVLKVWRYLNKDNTRRKTPKLKQGDFVRLAKPKGLFDKGYKPVWTDELFVIKRVIQHTEPVYRVEDLDGEELIGSFYEPELQKVTNAANREPVVESALTS